MRVGLAIETDSPGGAETMLLQLARELQEQGHEVVALGSTGGEGWLTGQFAELGIERELIEFRGVFGLRGVRRIEAVIHSRGLDVLHSHEFAMAVCGSLAARAGGCRHVITMHGGSYWGERARRRAALRLAAALSSHTVAVSEAFRETFAHTIGVRTKAVDVVHNGVAAIEGGDARLRQELGLGPDDVLILAVGNLLPVKGHAVLLAALPMLPMRSGRAVVAIAGRGPEEHRLRALAAELGIEHDVYFLGYRADARVALGGADVFAMPSLSEGLPMAMIEAMLGERAIVASDAGGIRELIDSPDVGLLVEPGEPKELAQRLEALINDPSLRKRLGAAAKARALEHFTASTMAEKYVGLYSD